MTHLMKLSCFLGIALVDGLSAFVDSAMERRNEYVDAVVKMVPEMEAAMQHPDVAPLVQELGAKFEALKESATRGKKSYEREFARREADAA